jgi:hypothetical protein
MSLEGGLVCTFEDHEDIQSVFKILQRVFELFVKLVYFSLPRPCGMVNRGSRMSVRRFGPRRGYTPATG